MLSRRTCIDSLWRVLGAGYRPTDGTRRHVETDVTTRMVNKAIGGLFVRVAGVGGAEATMARAIGASEDRCARLKIVPVWVLVVDGVDSARGLPAVSARRPSRATHRPRLLGESNPLWSVGDISGGCILW